MNDYKLLKKFFFFASSSEILRLVYFNVKFTLCVFVHGMVCMDIECVPVNFASKLKILQLMMNFERFFLLFAFCFFTFSLFIFFLDVESIKENSLKSLLLFCRIKKLISIENGCNKNDINKFLIWNFYGIKWYFSFIIILFNSHYQCTSFIFIALQNDASLY